MATWTLSFRLLAASASAPIRSSCSPRRSRKAKLSTPDAWGTGTNPEQLLAAGWSACFVSSIKIVAARMKVMLPADLAVDAEMDLGTTGGAYFLSSSPQRQPAGFGARSRPGPGGRRAPDVSVFQSHTGQHQRCD